MLKLPAVCGCVLLLTVFKCQPAWATPIVSSEVTVLESGEFLYTYVISGVDEGMKVDHLNLVFTLSHGPTFPSSFSFPAGWYFSILNSGYVANTGYFFGTASNPCPPGDLECGVIRAGQSAVISFTSGYAPKAGTFSLYEAPLGEWGTGAWITGAALLPNSGGTPWETTYHEQLWHVRGGYYPWYEASLPDGGSTLSLLVTAIAVVLTYRAVALAWRRARPT